MAAIHCVVRKPVHCIVQGTEGHLLQYCKRTRTWSFRSAPAVRTHPLSAAGTVSHHCRVSCSFRAMCSDGVVFKTQKDILAHYMSCKHIQARLDTLSKRPGRLFEAAVTLLACLCVPVVSQAGMLLQTAGTYRADGMRALGVPVGTHDQVLAWLQVHIARGKTPPVLLRRPDAIAATMAGAVVQAEKQTPVVQSATKPKEAEAKTSERTTS